MICEWCGETGDDTQHWSKVIYVLGCCAYFICPGCVSAGEERGGGIAVCMKCGMQGRLGSFREVITWWRPAWWRRKVKVTHRECRDGCASVPQPPGLYSRSCRSARGLSWTRTVTSRT